MGQNSSSGIVYIATGDEFIREAEQSARSVLDHNDVNITLFSDKRCNSDVFDDCEVIQDPQYDMGDSVLSPSQIPYEKTLFLDTDTYVTSSIASLFDSIEQFDIGCSFNIGTGVSYNNINKKDTGSSANPSTEVPDSFCEFNTGVLLLNKSTKVNEFLNRWADLYNKQKNNERNQPAFRRALFESDLQILPLPREYNYRLPKVAEVHDRINIIHGRHPTKYSKIDSCVNSKLESRVITRTDWPLDIISTNDVSMKFVLLYLFNTGNFYDKVELIRQKWNDHTVREIIDRII